MTCSGYSRTLHVIAVVVSGFSRTKMAEIAILNSAEDDAIVVVGSGYERDL
jgi:hypothetical protein